MEMVASLLWGAWEWVQTLNPGSAAAKRERDRVRLQIEEERAKPAGTRNEWRLLALRKKDSRLHVDYYQVRAQADDVGAVLPAVACVRRLPRLVLRRSTGCTVPSPDRDCHHSLHAANEIRLG